MSDTPPPAPVVVVPVKSAWWSKINWVQVGGALLNAGITLASGPAFGLEPEIQVKLLAALQLVQSVATLVIRTWYSKSVTPQSI